MAEETLQKCFGTIAMENGFITTEQLCEALKIQIMEEVEKKKHKLICTILFERGHMAFPQIHEVLQSTMTVSVV